jgi:tetratricopeptide (TPR) repeat protein
MTQFIDSTNQTFQMPLVTAMEITSSPAGVEQDEKVGEVAQSALAGHEQSDPMPLDNDRKRKISETTDPNPQVRKAVKADPLIEEETSPLLELPNELLFDIFMKLGGEGLLNLGLTCRQTREIILLDPTLYQSLLLERIYIKMTKTLGMIEVLDQIQDCHNPKNQKAHHRIIRADAENNPTRAVMAANCMEGKDKVKALCKIAKARIRDETTKDLLEQAQASANLIQGSEGGAADMIILGTCLKFVEVHVKSNPSLVLEMTGLNPHSSLSDSIFVEVAKARAMESPEDALDIAQKVNVDTRQSALSKIFKIQTKKSQFVQAEEMIELFKFNDSKVKKLCKLAKVLALTNKQKANELLEKARKINEQIRMPEDTFILPYKIEASIYPDKVNEIFRNARTFILQQNFGPFDDLSNDYLRLIATHQALTNLDEALETVEHISSHGIAAETIAEICETQALTNTELALSTSQLLPGAEKKWFRQSSAIIAIAREQALKNIELALVTVKSIHKEKKDEALLAIVKAIALTNPDGAEIIACRIGNIDFKSRALCEIAKALALADPDRAIAIADGIEIKKYKYDALCEIAKIWSQTDKMKANKIYHQTVAKAATIANPYKSIKFLSKISMVLSA